MEKHEFGIYGGQYLPPDILLAVREVENAYEKYKDDPGFQKEFRTLLCEYANRKEYPVELFEQPLKKDDYPGLKELAGRSPYPVILDETVFSRNDMDKAITERLGHGVNIKIAKSGITESLAIHVDYEIMEYDGRDYNKKACFSIVKKDNKKGKHEIY